MPDQNPIDPQNPTVTPIADTPPMAAPPESADMPAMDGSEVTPPPPIVVQEEEQEAAGSAAPPSNLPEEMPKKKFGRGRLVATILGVLILVGGLGAGLVLVRQQQDIREKADTRCPAGQECLSPSTCTSRSGTVGNFCNVMSGFKCCSLPPCTLNGQCLPSGGTCCSGVSISASEANCSSRRMCSSSTTPTPSPTCRGLGQLCGSPGDTCCTGTGLSCTVTDSFSGVSTCEKTPPTPTPRTCPADQECIHPQTCTASGRTPGAYCDASPGFRCCPKTTPPTPTPTKTGTPTPPGCGWPTNGTACKHTGGTAGKIGGCVYYLCPQGCGSDGKCGENDPGVVMNFSSSCSNSLIGNSCGQVDTVDTNRTYCIAPGCTESFIQCGPSCVKPTMPPVGDTTCRCLAVRAWDTNWNELRGDQLSALKAGDRVRFTVSATFNKGSIDKAKFKINGQETGEITTPKPGETAMYYYEYIMPAGVTAFTISAKIHHTTLGWSN